MQQTEFERTGNLEAYWRFSELCDRERNEGAIRGSIGRAREYQEPSCYDMLTTPQRPRVSLATRWEQDRAHLQCVKDLEAKRIADEKAAKERELAAKEEAQRQIEQQARELAEKKVEALIAAGKLRRVEIEPVLQVERKQEIPEEKPLFTAKYSVRDIIRAVSRFYGIPANELLSHRRHQTIAWPRQEAMILARGLTDKSLPFIGREFGGRDHTTIVHAVNVASKKFGCPKAGTTQFAVWCEKRMAYISNAILSMEQVAAE